MPRACAQLLSGPRARDPETVVRRLLAVQAQDARGARLAVRSRSVGTSAADVDDALNSRSMLIAWLNRGTLHLVAADDYWWLHPLTTPQLETGNRRRLRQEGVSAKQADRGVEIVTDAVLYDALDAQCRSLVRRSSMWLTRGTRHLVAADDWWPHPLRTRQLETGNPLAGSARPECRPAGLAFIHCAGAAWFATTGCRPAPADRDLQRTVPRLRARRRPRRGHVGTERNNVDREGAREGAGNGGRRAAPRRR